ncbi:MAG: PhnD/SsuA/transferrin family substrate-binding protein [Rhizobiales bacterium]|nr:PhnD/SsuA/transferrin family substrate-binding protein [Hyphomicrobiales bacterium]
MIASLGMYDWPEARAETDRLWAGIAAALREQGFSQVPETLERSTCVKTHWRSPDLLISQTCGYPLTHEFDGYLELLAAPIYGVEGCTGAEYTSAIVVNKASDFAVPADLKGAHATYNGEDSLSGHLALRSVFAPLADNGRFFGRLSRSGGHPASMQMIADGKADVAAIDCISFAFGRKHRSHITDNLRVIAYSPSAPALPYVTRTGRPQTELHRLKLALAKAFHEPTLADTRASLFIEGLEFTSRDTYDRVLQQEADAAALGYAELG